LFLIAVGIATTLTMHHMHQLGWNFAVTCITGMAAAMLSQMLMAFCAAPLLGSIETMTPSMVVGMVSPMFICARHMVGVESSVAAAMILGTMSGAGMFVFVTIYAAMFRRFLRRLHATR